jgi:hypothetical protein
MPQPLQIAQISDLHVKGAGELACGKVDTTEAIAACVDTLNRVSSRPHLVMISARPSYIRCRSAISVVRIPFSTALAGCSSAGRPETRVSHFRGPALPAGPETI